MSQHCAAQRPPVAQLLVSTASRLLTYRHSESTTDAATAIRIYLSIENMTARLLVLLRNLLLPHAPCLDCARLALCSVLSAVKPAAPVSSCKPAFAAPSLLFFNW